MLMQHRSSIVPKSKNKLLMVPRTSESSDLGMLNRMTKSL